MITVGYSTCIYVQSIMSLQKIDWKLVSSIKSIQQCFVQTFSESTVLIGASETIIVLIPKQIWCNRQAGLGTNWVMGWILNIYSRSQLDILICNQFSIQITWNSKLFLLSYKFWFFQLPNILKPHKSWRAESKWTQSFWISAGSNQWTTLMWYTGWSRKVLIQWLKQLKSTFSESPKHDWTKK